ncbi:diguanylate cyclase (GGDEF)-like protein [Saccharopolyspora erythraea NRRL 2338]|nr:diguanylate cyclase (GGDEF)-like protein [Saccharopolyspora erythraea NRRL 2338]
MREGQSWRRTTAAVAVVGIAAVGLVVSGSLEPAASDLVADLTGVVGAVAAAAAFAWTGWYESGAERRWRWLMVVALAWFATAHALWTWYRAIDPATFPNAANALYLGLPFFAFFAVLSMAKKDHGKVEEHDVAPSHAVVVLDGLIIVGSLVALSWKLTVDAVRHADGVPVDRLLMVTSYTLADLILIVIAILFATALYGLLRLPMAWLVLGLLAIGFSDAVYVYTISSSSMAPPVADVGYIVGPMLFLGAALAPNRQFSQMTPRTPLLFLPYVPFAAVCVFTVFTTATTGDPDVGEVYALIAVVALVVLRQVITLRQLSVARRQLAHQATHDPLTGASNRNLLLFRLDKALSRAWPPRSLGLLYADLDHFKQINDVLGHEAGDAVLCAVAARLNARIRPTDTLARMGGDEFVILLDPAPEDPGDFGRRIQSAFDEPVFVCGAPRVVSASLGYVGLDDHDSPDQALARADEAMYQAKAAGRHGIRINP